jgi:hypothetical protein
MNTDKRRYFSGPQKTQTTRTTQKGLSPTGVPLNFEPRANIIERKKDADVALFHLLVIPVCF